MLYASAMYQFILLRKNSQSLVEMLSKAQCLAERSNISEAFSEVMRVGWSFVPIQTAPTVGVDFRHLQYHIC